MAENKLQINVAVKLENASKIENRMKKQLAKISKQSKLMLNWDTSNLESSVGQITNKLNKMKFAPNYSSEIAKASKVTKVLSGDIEKLSDHTYKYGGMISHVFRKFSIWYGIGTLIRRIVIGFQDGVHSIIEMDRALTFMRITMDGTDAKFESMRHSAISFANELNTSIQKVTQAMEIYTNMNETVESILEKSKPTIVLSDLTGLGVDQTANAIQGLIFQFSLASDEATRLTDSLAYLASETSLEFQKAVNVMNESVARGGYLASEVGLTVDQYLAVVATIGETSRQSGSMIAAGLTTAFSRISRVSELSAEELSRVEGAYREIGIAIRDESGEIRNMWDILTDLNEVWSDLNSTTRNFISEQSAGIRQRRTFLALMNNFTTIQRRATEATEQDGFALSRHGIYMESLAGQLQKLQTEIQSTWMEIISSDAIKQLVKYARSLVDVFRGFLKILGGVTSLFGGFGNVIPSGLALLLSSQSVTIATKLTNVITRQVALHKQLKAEARSYADTRKYLTDSELKSFERNQVRLTYLQDQERNLNAKRKERIVIQEQLNNVQQRFNSLATIYGPLSLEQTRELSLMKQKRAELSETYNSLKRVEQAYKDNQRAIRKMWEEQEKYNRAVQHRKMVDQVVKSVFIAIEGVRTLNSVLDDSRTKFERIATGFSGIGNMLLMTGNVYAMVVGGVLQGVSAIFQLWDRKQKEAEQRLQRQREEYEESVNKVFQLNNLKQEYNELAREFRKTGNIKFMDEEDSKRLYEVMADMVAIDEELLFKYDAEGRAIVDLTKSYHELTLAIRENNEAQRQEQFDLKAQFLENTYNNLKQARTDYYKAIGAAERYRDLFGDDAKQVIEFQFNNLGNGSAVEEFTERLPDWVEGLEEYNLIMDALNRNWDEKNEKVSYMSTAIDKAFKSWQFFVNGEVEAIEKVEELEIALSDAEIAEKVKEATDAFNEFADKVNEVDDYLAKLDNQESLSTDDFINLLSQYPHLISYINDEVKLQEKLQEIREDSYDNQVDALKDLLELNTDYYKNVIDNNIEYFKNLKKNYDIDLINQKNLATAKLAIEKKLKQELDAVWEDRTGLYGEDGFDFDILNNRENQARFERHRAIVAENRQIIEEVEAIFDSFDLSSIFTSSVNNKGLTTSLANFADGMETISVALTRVNNRLEELRNILRILPEDDAQRIELLKRENELLRQKEGLLGNQARQYRTILDTNKDILNGFGVEFDGNDINYESYNSVLQSLNKSLTGASGSTRDNIQDQIKQLTEAFREYYQVQSSSLPQLQKEYISLYNSISENVIALKEFKLLAIDEELQQISNMFDLIGEVDNAEELSAYLKIFSKEQEVLNQKLETVNDLIRDYERELSSANDDTREGAIRVAYLKKALSDLNEQKVEIEIIINEKLEEEKNRMIDTIKEVEDAIIAMVEKRIDLQEEKENERHEDELDRINEEAEAWEDYYDARLNALKNEKREIDHNEKMNQLLEDRSQIQDELNKLTLDDSVEARARERELLEELKDVERDIAKETRDYEYEQAEQAIEEEKALKMDSIEEQREAEEESHNEALADFSEMREKANVYAEAHKILMTSTYEEISKMLKGHYEEWEDGFSAVGDVIYNDIFLQLQETINLMKQLGFTDGNPIGQALEESIKVTDELLKSISAETDSITDALSGTKDLKYGEDYIFAPPPLDPSQEQININVDTLLNVEGNVTEETVPVVTDAVNNSLKELEGLLNQGGIFRAVEP